MRMKGSVLNGKIMENGGGKKGETVLAIWHREHKGLGS
jgi:hypothetical protein